NLFLGTITGKCFTLFGNKSSWNSLSEVREKQTTFETEEIARSAFRLRPSLTKFENVIKQTFGCIN
ncbi:MAG TPA: hypothetical protein PL149_07920, partial [Candidatus Kapabacteria bacterium]|nr:hypothetical protein [Candidatus Kapabacteria bacterium]